MSMTANVDAAVCLRLPPRWCGADSEVLEEEKVGEADEYDDEEERKEGVQSAKRVAVVLNERLQ